MRVHIALIATIFLLNMPGFINMGYGYKAGPYLHNPADTLKKEKPKKINANCTAIANLTGNTCLGSTLTVSANETITSVEWIYEGTTTVAKQTAGLQPDAIIVAGNGTAGSGAGQLDGPDRLFVDKDGTMYIPDLRNNRVQKWLPGATQGTTVAGGNGVGNALNQLSKPSSVVLDQAGNLYVAEQGNNRITKWVPGATAGIIVAAGLNDPTGIFIDGGGNIFVSEQYNYDVLKFAPGSSSGIVVAGGHDFGREANQLDGPTGIFVDATGNLYICDANNNRIQKWAPGATEGVTVAGMIYDHRLPLTIPLGIYVDTDGTMYIADYIGARLWKWPAGEPVGEIIAGEGSSSNIQSIAPIAVWMDVNKNLYSADFDKNIVYEFPRVFDGTFTPPKTGTYQAKVTTASGCVVMSNSVTITNPNIPVIQISATSNIICSKYPNPVFTGVPTYNGKAATYQWKINDANVGPRLNTLDTFSPAGLKKGDKVSCEMTSSEVCVTTPVVQSNAIIIDDIAIDKPEVVVSTDTPTPCQGSSIKFTATPSNAGDAPSFQWYLNQTSIANETGATYTSAQLKNGDEISCNVISNAKNCQVLSTAVSNSYKVTITTLVTPSITIAASATAINAGTTVTFTAAAQHPGNNPQYEWQINGTAVSTGASATYSSSELLNGDKVTCLLLSDEECSSTNTALSNTVTMRINVPVTISTPNTFTPNGDGINDTWKIGGIASLTDVKVDIYNRYGQPVFHSVGYAKEWAGTNSTGNACAAGVYYYVINLDTGSVLSGTVTLLK